YRKFEDERNRPIKDLLTQISGAAVEYAADLGCGPGNSTEFLHRRFPQATVVGVDSSPEMIEAARKRLPAIGFQIDDVDSGRGGRPCAVILSNAALQWVPDHGVLLPRLFAALAPGGRLAVQIPDNFDEPAHRLMREIAADARWSAALASAPRALGGR